MLISCDFPRWVSTPRFCLGAGQQVLVAVKSGLLPSASATLHDLTPGLELLPYLRPRTVGGAGRWAPAGHYMALGFCGRRRRRPASFCCMESARLAGEPETVGK